MNILDMYYSLQGVANLVCRTKAKEPLNDTLGIYTRRKGSLLGSRHTAKHGKNMIMGLQFSEADNGSEIPITAPSHDIVPPPERGLYPNASSVKF
jgi:hypothetical protein